MRKKMAPPLSAPAPDLGFLGFADRAASRNRNRAELTPPPRSVRRAQGFHIGLMATNECNSRSRDTCSHQRLTHGEERRSAQAGAFVHDQERSARSRRLSHELKLLRQELCPAIVRMAHRTDSKSLRLSSTSAGRSTADCA